jgi:sarcosine oxidase/L-pipecolate oxidase
MVPKRTDKVIIVGAGVYGLSATLSLLKDGYTDVHLFDKNDYFVQHYSYFKGCDSASSDMNKIFRASYGEKTWYQQMSLKSRDTFLQWNKQIAKCGWEGGAPVYINSGNVHLTDSNELPEFERITLQNMGDQAINVRDPDAFSKAAKFGLTPKSVDPFGKNEEHNLQGVLDTTGGTMIADRMCRYVLKMCLEVGKDRLQCHFGKPVDKLLTSKGKCVGIIVAGENHHADFVAVFGGSWTTQLVPEASSKVEATGGSVVLCKITDPKALEKYNEQNFPAWTYKVRDGAMGGLYGFPVNKDGYLKIGYRGLKWINPTQDCNSKTKTAYTKDVETNIPTFGLLRIKNFLKKFVPEVTEITKTRLCWYSDTTDNDFLIGYCPGYKETLFVGCGDSGHGFMMFGALGDVIKDIIHKKGDPFLRDLFSWERERERLNEINLGLDDPRALQNLKMSTPRDWKL